MGGGRSGIREKGKGKWRPDVAGVSGVASGLACVTEREAGGKRVEQRACGAKVRDRGGSCGEGEAGGRMVRRGRVATVRVGRVGEEEKRKIVKEI
ncbi:hypothetical protein GOBAR_AA11796 [Gossypium barbadense]|uniref:Uncharacterized protein n=1 Tax=Gossypium barbadense TaxID=3634 RepID=A0A2P5XZS9_GOSBA|nr:hypothetical protein GOBAR_AA11796 [Gossypium barbadense]